jgi:tripartite-type tricarboxylate transporter receptor subunit TctC
VPGFESSAWFGVFAPANLPDAITEKLNAVIVGALAEPKLREQLKNEGATSVGNTPKEFAAFVREDIEAGRRSSDHPERRRTRGRE